MIYTGTHITMSVKQVENLYLNRGASTTEQLAITRQMVMLQAASARISESLDHHEVYQTIPVEFSDIFSFDNCTFYLIDPVNKQVIKRSEFNPEGMVLPAFKQIPLTLKNNHARNKVVAGRKTVPY